MGSLTYLVGTGAKNAIKELVHKPGKLILYLMAAVGFLFMILSSLFGDHTGGTVLPMPLVGGIFFGFLTMMLVSNILASLSTGRSIFSMSDVDHLFVSPIDSRAIMLYGLVKQMGFSLLSGIFILVWAPALSVSGVNISGVLALFLIFGLSMVIQSVLSMFIYSLTSSSPRRKLIVKVLLVLMFVPAVAYFAVGLAGGAASMTALEQTLGSLFVKAIPIVGWAAAGMMALLQGQWLACALWLGLLVLAGVGMVLYLTFGKVDYYEDVLAATETAYERKRAQEDGNLQESMAASPAKVRVAKTGIKGSGASALFYKHLRETFRENRFGFFGLNTLVRLAAVVGLVFLFAGESDIILLLLMALMWMQCIMIGTGRGLRELYTPYIYLIPESPVRKELWSNMETVLKTLAEGILFFVVPGIIMKNNPLLVIGGIIVYTLFSLVLLGVNYLSLRWTQTTLSSPVMMLMYLAVVLAVMAPGIAAAMVVGFMAGGEAGMVLGLLILAAWEVLAALGCFALSRNILNRCDMPNAVPNRTK